MQSPLARDQLTHFPLPCRAFLARQNAMTRSLERLLFSGRNEAALGGFNKPKEKVYG
jgi:hypothetical protein